MAVSGPEPRQRRGVGRLIYVYRVSRAYGGIAHATLRLVLVNIRQPRAEQRRDLSRGHIHGARAACSERMFFSVRRRARRETCYRAYLRVSEPSLPLR